MTTAPIASHEPRPQEFLPGMCPIASALELLATSGGIETRGAVFTRREVVDFLLDLTRYTADRELHHLRLLEPSFGRGDFLLPAVERLLIAWNAAKKASEPVDGLSNCIRAVELHRETFAETKSRVVDVLVKSGIPANQAFLVILPNFSRCVKKPLLERSYAFIIVWFSSVLFRWDRAGFAVALTPH